MSVSEEFADWFARNAHRFEVSGPTVNEAEHVALWQCKDGWIVGYTTSRVAKGPVAGKFVTVAYKPTGKGARTDSYPPSSSSTTCATGRPIEPPRPPAWGAEVERGCSVWVSFVGGGG